MKNYNDPTVWNEFLTEHRLEAGTPPPDKGFYESCPDCPEQIVPLLKSWAHVRRPSRAQEQRRMADILDRNDEETVYPEETPT